MRTRICIHCSLIRSLRLASFKVCLRVIVLSVTEGIFVYFVEIKIFVDFVSFLSMIIYEVLYTYMMFKV